MKGWEGKRVKLEGEQKENEKGVKRLKKECGKKILRGREREGER